MCAAPWELIADTRGVSVDEAFVAIVVAFAAGWVMRRWRAAENTARLARRGADIAGGAAWKARLWFAGAAILIWGLADAWIRSRLMPAAPLTLGAGCHPHPQGSPSSSSSRGAKACRW